MAVIYILYALKLMFWPTSNSVSVFFITQLGHGHYLSIYYRYLVVMACKPTVTVQSQICGALTVSSMISLYLAGK